MSVEVKLSEIAYDVARWSAVAKRSLLYSAGDGVGRGVQTVFHTLVVKDCFLRSRGLKLKG